MGKVTTSTFRKYKKSGEKISMITAYDFPTAKMYDECGIDAILVGDSLGNVILGYPNTTFVTMEDIIHHTKAVTRAVENAMVVADMPFLSYNLSIRDSVINAGRLIQEGGATAVKLEGGVTVYEHIKAIVDAGIPVMGHLGFTPQSINKFGGAFYQGKTDEGATKLIEDAKAVEDAGAFGVVLECVPQKLAEEITAMLKITTIGIGAGVSCDGQVLVSHDLLGMYPSSPKFSKQYASLGDIIKSAVKQYSDDVKSGAFPDKDHIIL